MCSSHQLLIVVLKSDFTERFRIIIGLKEIISRKKLNPLYYKAKTKNALYFINIKYIFFLRGGGKQVETISNKISIFVTNLKLFIYYDSILSARILKCSP